MFPNRPEWKSWSSLDKATYIAQLAAALSLLPTVMFAWLGWREARIARSEQTQFFIAEKAPELEITSIRILDIATGSNGILTVFVHNVGGSPVWGLVISLTKIGETKPMAIDSFWQRVAVPRGKELSIPFVRVDELRGHFGWQPESARVFRLGDALENREEVVAILLIRFAGEFNDEHALMETVAMKRMPPNPSLERTPKKRR